MHYLVYSYSYLVSITGEGVWELDVKGNYGKIVLENDPIGDSLRLLQNYIRVVWMKVVPNQQTCNKQHAGRIHYRMRHGIM